GEAAPEVAAAERVEQPATAEPERSVAGPLGIGQPEVGMAECVSEPAHVRETGERDDCDTTPACVNLIGMKAKLRQVLLAKEAAEMAQKHQDRRAAEQVSSRIRPAI